MDDLFEKILDDINRMTDEEFEAALAAYKDSDVVLALQAMEECLCLKENV